MNTENSELNFLRRIQLAKCVSAKDIQDPDELRTCITSAEEDLAQTMSALGFQYVATAMTTSTSEPTEDAELSGQENGTI